MNDITTENGFSIHYCLEDNNCYSIDAETENQGTSVFLKSANYVSHALNSKIYIKTTSLGKGSVIRYFRLELKDGDVDNNIILLSIVTYLLQQCFFYKKSVGIDQLIKVFGKDEKKLREVLQRKHVSENTIKNLSTNDFLSRQRNTFYDSVLKEKDIKYIDFSRGKNFAKDESDKVTVQRSDFNSFIESIEPEIKEIKDAKIYIVSPILLKMNDKKWSGLYNGEFISFKVLSRDFKAKSQDGSYKFSTGFNIICNLRYKLRYDEEGIPHNYDYEVTFVSQEGVDGNYKLTFEAKKKKIDDTMPSLFDNPDFYK